MGGNPLIIAEPAGPYAHRPPLVVDCNVLAAVLFDEPEREAAAEVMSGRALCAPDLIDHELVSVALKKGRAGLDEQASQGLSDLARLELSRYRIEPEPQWQIAKRHGLTAYDAAYLWLALELGAPLVTYDKRLGEAAGAVIGGQGRTNAL